VCCVGPGHRIKSVRLDYIPGKQENPALEAAAISGLLPVAIVIGLPDALLSCFAQLVVVLNLNKCERLCRLRTYVDRQVSPATAAFALKCELGCCG
jgi:hypothetical protein